MVQPLTAFAMNRTRVQRPVRHLVITALMLLAVLKVMLDAHTHYFFLDLVPEHFHRLRDNRSGEFGSFAALG